MARKTEAARKTQTDRIVGLAKAVFAEKDLAARRVVRRVLADALADAGRYGEEAVQRAGVGDQEVRFVIRRKGRVEHIGGVWDTYAAVKTYLRGSSVDGNLYLEGIWVSDGLADALPATSAYHVWRKRNQIWCPRVAANDYSVADNLPPRIPLADLEVVTVVLRPQVVETCPVVDLLARPAFGPNDGVWLDPIALQG